MKDQALAQALARRGMAARVARAVGISTGAVAQWSRCPAEHAGTVEAVTGVPRYELRPDLWQSPSAASVVADRPDANAVLRAVEQAQAVLRRYVDPSDSLSEELIRDRRAAAARGE